ncbi:MULTISPECIES: glucosamine-6-phosphate deaminase [unclassified Rathayibacter]|uniref:glucosamine-6-phosphate deaminase n=1 Tax=unclassified Rathayibacter TaxID=2609250 RepID=UPI0010D63A6D|nr:MULTISPECIES: glucosamine-6-phosphate deaminase [unclassified Rathayibacter]TCL82522.1 glucosamine-6-phosphate deaminase [Rathayibacter sp. PhB192]TCM27861.1 glucosamine-6-phosphate deaminase [Rathayibacter sp. PhB179]
MTIIGPTTGRTGFAPGTSVRVVDSFAEASRAAADLVAARVLADPRAVLGVATGSTPSLLYRELAGRVAAGRLDFTGVSAFALDEYVGIDPGHPESYRAVLDREVRVPLGVGAVHVPDGTRADGEQAGRDYDAAIRAAGGVELQILGIGGNGHIGFNEPGTPHDVGTHVVRLERSTREANARFFDGRIDLVPESAITQGIATILAARSLVLLASGAAKADAVARSLLGPVDVDCPASALQGHPDVTVLLDREAAAVLERELG